MAISTSFQLKPVFTGFSTGSRPISTGESFHDHFIPSQTSDLTLSRPNFQTSAALTETPQMQQESWNSSLTTLSFSGAANDSSWVQDHKEFQRECYYCDGTGKCQHDDVAGSGKISGEDDYEFCGGTGKCEHCGGDGDMGN